MKLIPGALPLGQQCAVLPNRSTDPVGFIHTRRILMGLDPEVFVSASAVKEMGRLLGMHTHEDVHSIQMQLDVALAELRELQGRVDDLTKLRELEMKVVS